MDNNGAMQKMLFKNKGNFKKVTLWIKNAIHKIRTVD